MLFYINVNERSSGLSAALLKDAADAGTKAAKKLERQKGQDDKSFKAAKEKAKLDASAGFMSKLKPSTSLRRGDKVFQQGDVASTMSGNLNSGLAGAKAANNQGNANSKNPDETLYAARLQSSRRLQSAIALYMPPQVQTSYNLQYSDVEFGFKGQAFGKLFDVVSGQDGAPSGGEVTSFAQKLALGSLNMVAPGAASAVAIKQGKILSNRMELSFQGVGRREFSFTFNFTPKSEDEAKTIEDIVSTFKYYSHPDFIEGTGGNMMTIPDTFDISYMYQGHQNAFLNKISTCFCTNIQVQYGGDRFTAFTPTKSRHEEGSVSPPPTKTILTLQFKELEIITKPRIEQGY